MAQTSPPSITALPAVPDRADRVTFSARATAMFDAFKNVFVSEVSAVASNVYNNAVDAYNNATSAASSASTAATQAELATTNGAAQVALATTQANNAAASAASAVLAPGTSATSTTSLTIGTGSKALTIQTGKQFAIGQFLIVANTATPNNYMRGQVTAHNNSTGDLTLNVADIGGSGTYDAWTVALNTATIAAAQSVPGGASIYTALNFGGF